jgi:hypothetical protein
MLVTAELGRFVVVLLVFRGVYRSATIVTGCAFYGLSDPLEKKTM